MNGIFYKDKEHRELLISNLKALNRIYSKYNDECDLYYLPALYILNSDKELRSKCLNYVTVDGINFTKLFEEKDFSSSYKNLVKLANHLFNENEDVKIMDLIATLDENNFELAIQAIRLRRHSRDLREL